MTPKEKAKELIERFTDVPDCDKHYYDNRQPCEHQAKECALILIDEILSLHMINNMGRDETYSEGEFWEQVKKELTI